MMRPPGARQVAQNGRLTTQSPSEANAGTRHGLVGELAKAAPLDLGGGLSRRQVRQFPHDGLYCRVNRAIKAALDAKDIIARRGQDKIFL
jgi:hypothetical protein